MRRNRVLSNSFGSLLAGAFKLISGFLLLKWAVQSFGKENLVYLGQINSIFLISTSVASIGLYSGIVALSSKNKLEDIVSNSLSYLLFLMLPGLVLLNILWFSTVENILPLGSPIHIVVNLLFLSFPFQHVVLGVINIHLPSRYTYYCRIFATCFVLAIGFLTTRFQDGGYLINAFSGSLIFLIGLLVLSKRKRSTFLILKNSRLNYIGANDFVPFAKIFSFSILVMPVVKIIVREYLLFKSSAPVASYWQAYLTISDSYTVVLTIFLSSYYLRYASVNKNENILKVASSVAYLLMPLCLLGLVIMYFVFPYLLREILAFEINFNSDLRLGILVGDFFRFSTLLLTYNFIVRGYVKASIFFELLQGLLYLSFVIIAFEIEGSLGASLGYALAYSALFTSVVFFSAFYKNDLSAR